jgi:hypothetical protein
VQEVEGDGVRGKPPREDEGGPRCHEGRVRDLEECPVVCPHDNESSRMQQYFHSESSLGACASFAIYTPLRRASPYVYRRAHRDEKMRQERIRLPHYSEMTCATLSSATLCLVTHCIDRI